MKIRHNKKRSKETELITPRITLDLNNPRHSQFLSLFAEMEANGVSLAQVMRHLIETCDWDKLVYYIYHNGTHTL